MAKLSELIEVFSEVLRVPTTTPESYVRVLRKNGLLTTGGRGRSAPEIITRDVTMTFAAMLAESPTHAVENIEHIKNMAWVSQYNFAEKTLVGAEFLSTLPGGLLKTFKNEEHSFFDILDALFETAFSNPSKFRETFGINSSASSIGRSSTGSLSYTKFEGWLHFYIYGSRVDDLGLLKPWNFDLIYENEEFSNQEYDDEDYSFNRSVDLSFGAIARIAELLSTGGE